MIHVSRAIEPETFNMEIGIENLKLWTRTWRMEPGT